LSRNLCTNCACLKVTCMAVLSLPLLQKTVLPPPSLMLRSQRGRQDQIFKPNTRSISTLNWPLACCGGAIKYTMFHLARRCSNCVAENQ
jgi:hypothetical protein